MKDRRTVIAVARAAVEALAIVDILGHGRNKSQHCSEGLTGRQMDDSGVERLE